MVVLPWSTKPFITAETRLAPPLRVVLVEEWGARFLLSPTVSQRQTRVRAVRGDPSAQDKLIAGRPPWCRLARQVSAGQFELLRGESPLRQGYGAQGFRPTRK